MHDGLILFHFLYSTKPAGQDVIGIELGTTNSCVSVMEGKVDFKDLSCCNESVFVY